MLAPNRRRLHARQRRWPIVRLRRRPVRLVGLAVLGLAGVAAALPLLPRPAGAVFDASGQVVTLGRAVNAGGAPGRSITGIARTPGGGGYWLVGTDGGVFSFGDAGFRGSMAATPLRQPIADIAATPEGTGYWLVGTDGGVFAFGDARFLGSVGDIRINGPVVAMAATPTGGGYWLLANDGGVFAFGDAPWLGAASLPVAANGVVAISGTPTGKGYRILARDGTVLAFGDAHLATSGAAGRAPSVDLATAADGEGYWIASADGTVQALGSAPAVTGAQSGPLGAPVTGIDANREGDGVWMVTGGEKLGNFGVTCYALQGTTASGVRVSSDVVAVDPRAIPLGTELYVEGVGLRRALDTGGAIRGKRLDIWHPSTRYCREFGVRHLAAYVLR